MMPSLLCLLFFDAVSDHACVFLCVSMHLESELLTHQEIPMQCAMATQEWMATQYDQASDTCMQTDQTCATTQRRTGLHHLSQHLRHWLPVRDNQVSGPGTSPSFRSKVYAALVKTCARRNTVHLHPLCAQRTSLRASDSLDKAQHQLSPPKLRIPIPYYTSYSTISPSYTPLPRVMTVLALQTSFILEVEFHAVCRVSSVVHRWTTRRASLGSQ